MSLCLNPDCPKPENLQDVGRCRACGSSLLLRNRYRSIAAIGQGGFGRTFLAVDESQPDKPQCVIKQFLPLHQGERHLKKAAEMFEQEARRLEELGSHPQIPALLDHFGEAQQQYLIQEFIDGPTIEEILAQRGAFSEAQIRSLLSSLLPVLQFIHSRNVIHRDIKPANIIATVQTQAQPGESKGSPIDWNRMRDALAQEARQGCRNLAGYPVQFHEFLSRRFNQLPASWAIGDYRRCQDLAEQFTNYPRLSFSQRQYLVADASRFLYELRQKYETSEATGGTNLDETLVLVDFGAAKAVQGILTQTGTAIGSPEYQAPEQARGKAVFASDLYSLGVTCLHLLTNTSPLDLFDSNESTWLWRRYLKSHVSPDLAHILDKLIEPGLRRRYPSAIAVLHALTPPLPHSPTPHRPISPPPHPTARSPKKPTPTWHCLRSLPHPGKVSAIALSSTEPILSSSSGTTIKLWDWEMGQPIRILSGHLDLVSAIVISPDGKLLISGSADKTIRIWELATGKRLGNLTLHTDTVLALVLSSDGNLLASSSLYDPIVLLDMTTGQERDRLYGHDLRIDALALSPDGALLASGSADGTVKLWETATCKELRTLEGHEGVVATIGFSPDGKTLVSGSWDGTVRFWSTRIRRQNRSLELNSGRVNAIALSPDGKLLATGSDTLKLWQVRSGKEIATLPGHLSSVTAIAFSSDSRTLVSSSLDGTVRVWRFG